MDRAPVGHAGTAGRELADPRPLGAGEAFVKAKRKRPNVILKTVQTGKAPRSGSPVWPQVSDALQTMMQDLLQGTKAQDAADKAATAMNESCWRTHSAPSD